MIGRAPRAVGRAHVTVTQKKFAKFTRTLKWRSTARDCASRKNPSPAWLSKQKVDCHACSRSEKGEFFLATLSTISAFQVKTMRQEKSKRAAETNNRRQQKRKKNNEMLWARSVQLWNFAPRGWVEPVGKCFSRSSTQLQAGPIARKTEPVSNNAGHIVVSLTKW